MNRWQNTIGIALLSVLTLSFDGCRSNSPEPTTSFRLRVNQSAHISADVTVRVDSIQDSRCPKDVQCIWAGEAVVAATLLAAQDSAAVRLTLGVSPAQNQRRDSTGVRLGAQTYAVVLRSVNPYPEVQGNQVQKEAVIDVIKQ